MNKKRIDQLEKLIKIVELIESFDRLIDIDFETMKIIPEIESVRRDYMKSIESKRDCIVRIKQYYNLRKYYID